MRTDLRTILLMAWFANQQGVHSAEELREAQKDNDHYHGEYCTGETFQPRCSGGKNDVIVILTARYGRMSFGRCLKKEPVFESIMNDQRFLGCFTDVKGIIDQHCSGQSDCDFRVTDMQNFVGVNPCYAGLKMHLEASFICVKVAAESRHCTVALAAEPQHIVGGAGRSRLAQSDTVGCGTELRPWSIEALAGQRIAVSLYDFDTVAGAGDALATQVSTCHPIHGYIIDRNTRRNVSVCIKNSLNRTKEIADVQTEIYVSSSNQLQISTKNDLENKFIVRVAAVGCSDLAPPSDDAWLKRVDDQITIGCYMSRQSWQLNCVNGVWTGTVGVCSSNHHANSDLLSELSGGTRDQFAFEQDGSHQLPTSTKVAALAAITSVGVALCCLVICVGVLCLRKQKMRTRKEACIDNLDANAKRANQHSASLMMCSNNETYQH